ncbi:hypothetical protein Tco_1207421 [Tanacetum coccineum]
MSHTRSDAPSSGTPPLLPIPTPTSLPPLLLPSTNRKEDIPEVTLPPRKRLGIALGLKCEVGESSSAAAARPTGGSRADYGFVATMDREMRRDPKRYVGYGITDTWDEMHEDMPAAPATDDTELGRWMTEFATRVRRAHARTGYVTAYNCIGSAGSDYRVTGSEPHETTGDYRVAGSRLQETGIKMAPKRATRSNTDPKTTNTTSITNAQLQAMINQGVTAALAARDADRNTNGDDNHNSGTSV